MTTPDHPVPPAAGQRHWHFGSAPVEQVAHRGWVVGHFIEPDDIRHSTDVEIKWGIHRAGERRAAWQQTEHRTAVTILLSGRFRVDFDGGGCTLEHPGDYAMWGPGVGHSWRAEEHSTVITIRWPSTAPPVPGRLEARGAAWWPSQTSPGEEQSG